MAFTPTSQEQLVQLVQRVDDRQQLSELISRYGIAVDDRDFDTLASLFAPDVQFQHVKGRDAVIAFYKMRTALFSTSTHYAHTWHFDFSSETQASGVVSASAELCIQGQTVRLSLRYIDRYIKTTTGWVFHVRDIKFRYVLPLDQVAQGLDQPLRVRWPGTEPRQADLPDLLQTYIDSRTTPVPL
jgi:hypothetical protein